MVYYFNYLRRRGDRTPQSLEPHPSPPESRPQPKRWAPLIYQANQANGSNAKPMAPTCAESSEFPPLEMERVDAWARDFSPSTLNAIHQTHGERFFDVK